LGTVTLWRPTLKQPVPWLLFCGRMTAVALAMVSAPAGPDAQAHAPRGRPWRSQASAVLLALVAWTAAPAAEHVLRDDALAQTPRGRQDLKYLVGCALPQGTAVVATVDGMAHRFEGSMGLAPDWLTRPLTEPQQRLVSACILARSNFHGKTVLIAISSDAVGATPSLKRTPEEEREFPFLEAGFFGNLFKAQPEAYVCTAGTSPARERHLQALFRVCSLPPDDVPPDKAVRGMVSRCGFVLAGECRMRPFVQGGTDHTAEVLTVHLPGPAVAGRPTGRSLHR
jgi:hypothetical protein